MKNENALKETVKQKYGEIALQEKKPINPPAAALVVVQQKFTTL